MRLDWLVLTVLVTAIKSVHAQLLYRVSECRGFYGPQEVHSKTSGFISVSITPILSYGSIAITIINLLDTNQFVIDPFSGHEFICTKQYILNGICSKTELGKLHIVQPSSSGYTRPMYPILSERILWAPPNTIDGDAITLNDQDGIGLRKRQDQAPTISATTTTNTTVTSQTTVPTSSVVSGSTTIPTLSTSLPAASPSPTIPAPPVYIINSTTDIVYNVAESGMYCVLMLTEQKKDQDYYLSVVMNGPYGLLPGMFYPAWIFYGVISMAYLILGIVWMSLSFKYWKDILPIQHFVSGVIAFLIIEMAFNFGMYDNYNNTGVVSIPLMIFVVIFNSGRISLSFFMLLIVALGYGVVKPTLGDTMKRCIILTVVHFVFGVSYATASLVSAEKNNFTIIILVIPLSLTMMAFYVWTFTAITETMARLEARRQSVKLRMYNRLGYILTGSAVAIIVIAAANSVNLTHRNDPKWIAVQWKWHWMLLDGAMNTIYFLVFVSILILWRPTENNQRYGLDQLAQDDPDEDINGIKLHEVLHNVDEFGEFDDEFGQFHDDELESAEDVLKWVEQNVGSTQAEANGVVVGSATGVGLGETEVRSRHSNAFTPVQLTSSHVRLQSEDVGLPDAHSSDKLI